MFVCVFLRACVRVVNVHASSAELLNNIFINRECQSYLETFHYDNYFFFLNNICY